MNDSIKKFEKHDQLMLLLSREDLNEEDEEYIQSIICDYSLDWEKFLGKVFFNRVNGLVYINIKKYKNVPREVYSSLELMYSAQYERMKFHMKELNNVSKILEENNISHAFLKGSILNLALYPIGARISNDTDILISTAHIGKCTELLEREGYIQGTYDKKENSIIKASKQLKVFIRLNTHELVNFVKLTNSPFMNRHSIDVNHKLEVTSDPEMIKSFLQDSILLENENYSLRTLPWEIFLIHLSVHLFREATLVTKIFSGSDMQLYKFLDIHRLITNKSIQIDWEKLRNISQEFNLIHYVYYALYCTEILYPNSISSKVLQNFKPENIEYIDQYKGKNDSNEIYTWSKSFEERVFDYKRKVEASTNIKLEFDRFVASKEMLIKD